MREMWLVGSAIGNSYTVSGIFEFELDAINHATHDNFVALVDTDTMLPKFIIDSKKIFWPHIETWDTSLVYRLINLN